MKTSQYVEVEVDLSINHTSLDIPVDVNIDDFVNALSPEQKEYVEMSLAIGGMDENEQYWIDQAKISCHGKEIPFALYQYLKITTGNEFGQPSH